MVYTFRENPEMPQETDVGGFAHEGSLLELATLLADVTSWSGALLHLYQSTFTPTPNNHAADFLAAEATFTGYSPQALTYGAVGLDANGVPTALSDRAFFQATDGASPNTIGGCWVQADAVGPPVKHTVIRYYNFATPKQVTAALQFLGIVLGIQDPENSGFAIVDN